MEEQQLLFQMGSIWLIKSPQRYSKAAVEGNKLDAVISLPSGVFKPYAGVSCAIVIFTKTNSGGTDNVWFYDMQADGYSLDDKRNPLLDENKLGVSPALTLSDDEHSKNNLPDILARWNDQASEIDRPRTAQSFMVDISEIRETGSWDLSLNRYKEIEYEEIKYANPTDIISDLKSLNDEISRGLSKLQELL